MACACEDRVITYQYKGAIHTAPVTIRCAEFPKAWAEYTAKLAPRVRYLATRALPAPEMREQP